MVKVTKRVSCLDMVGGGLGEPLGKVEWQSVGEED
jgi:hypothetical protein